MTAKELRLYTKEELKIYLKAFHLDILEGEYTKKDLEFINNWIEKTFYASKL